MIMPGSPRISGEAFAIERLREDPDLDYAAVRRLADEAGVAMQPILYGRARRHLGLPPARNKGPVLTTGTRREPTPEPIEIEARDETPMDTTPEADTGDAAEEAAPSPKKKGSVAFEFLVAELRREPNMLYAELRRRAEAKGFPIAPIMYGRAKAVLGLVPVKPRGSKKDKDAAAATTPAAPRVLKQVESVAADRFSQKLEEVRNIDQLVQAVKELDAERRRLRGLLEKIVTMIDEALG
jgi:hypothetical protein